MCGDAVLKPCSYVLLGYTGSKVPLLGMADVKVVYEDQQKQLPVIVVEGDKPWLLGRNWMAELRLNWKKILHINNVNESAQRNDIASVLQNHRDVFETKDQLNIIKDFTVDIKLEKGAQPIFKKARPVPYFLVKEVEKELNKLEKKGVIKKVKSSRWASPIVLAPKSDGSIRICGDYKATINTCVESRPYPLPTADDILSTLAGGRYFSKIDLSSAYQQLALTNESKEKLTINTPKGLYQYERLPFGVSTAPSVFQCVMDQVLEGIDGVCCFLDDVLISTNTMKKHVIVLDSVLQRLQDRNILAKKSKCEFAVSEVTYLGHRINRIGLQPTEEKMQAIVQTKTPTCVSELKSLLGMVTYYQKFIPNLSSVCAPLYTLLQKNKTWCWIKDCEEAHNKLKQALSSDSLLVHYDPRKPLLLSTDDRLVWVV